MRPHIGHMRFYVEVLKMSIQSYTRKAKDSNHIRKKRMFQICPEPTEPSKQIKGGAGGKGAKKRSSDKDKVGKEKSRDH